MKLLLKSLVLSAVVLSTTFCSKEQPNPGPSTASEMVAGANPNTQSNYGPPLGFNPQTCNTDEAGVGPLVSDEARNNAYNWNGSQISNADFNAFGAAIGYNNNFTLDANGHVNPGVAYATRLNGFTDNVKAQLDEYNYYVYWAALHGSQVENPEDVKGIIQEQFDLTIPVQPEEQGSLSQTDKNQITLITAAARAQMQRSFALLNALYDCESTGTARLSGSAAQPADGQKEKTASKTAGGVMSFKAFLAQRKAGKISDDPGYSTQRSFWSKLKNAAYKAFTVVVFTAIGAAVGFTQGFATAGVGSVPGAFIGGAFGFTLSLRLIRDNRCLFGACQ